MSLPETINRIERLAVAGSSPNHNGKYAGDSADSFKVINDIIPTDSLNLPHPSLVAIIKLSLLSVCMETLAC